MISSFDCVLCVFSSVAVHCVMCVILPPVILMLAEAFPHCTGLHSERNVTEQMHKQNISHSIINQSLS